MHTYCGWSLSLTLLTLLLTLPLTLHALIFLKPQCVYISQVYVYIISMYIYNIYMYIYVYIYIYIYIIKLTLLTWLFSLLALLFPMQSGVSICTFVLYWLYLLYYSSGRTVYYIILLALGGRYSVYLLYWYESANTDATSFCWRSAAGTHFTCFTGTRVQILTQKALLEDRAARDLLPSSCKIVELGAGLGVASLM